MKIISILDILLNSDLSDLEKRTLVEIFNSWESDPNIDYRIIRNIKTEHFIDKDSWKGFINAILLRKDLPFNRLKYEVTNEIIQNYLLRGDKIKLDYPQYIGTVMLFEDFVFNLTNIDINKSKFARKINIRDNFIKNIFSNHEIEDKFKSIVIKKPDRLIWFTFDENDSETPFPFLRFNTSKELLTGLALEDERFARNTKLAVFIFKSKDLINQNIILYRPTFCDSLFYVHFLPTESELRYGQTNPLNSGDITIRKNHIKIERRPEIVVRSEEISLEYLSKAIITY
jgi:hypothetical protein